MSKKQLSQWMKSVQAHPWKTICVGVAVAMATFFGKPHVGNLAMCVSGLPSSISISNDPTSLWACLPLLFQAPQRFQNEPLETSKTKQRGEQETEECTENKEGQGPKDDASQETNQEFQLDFFDFDDTSQSNLNFVEDELTKDKIFSFKKQEHHFKQQQKQQHEVNEGGKTNTGFHSEECWVFLREEPCQFHGLLNPPCQISPECWAWAQKKLDILCNFPIQSAGFYYKGYDFAESDFDWKWYVSALQKKQ